MASGIRTDVDRATHLLEGIIQGISLDHEVNDGEVAALTQWLDLHSNLLERYPFSEIRELLRDVLRDQVVEEHERQDLLDWCQTFNDNSNAANVAITQATRRLHGVLAGIAMDRTVSVDELRDLQDWLRDHERFRREYPFAETWDLIGRVLSDGRISAEEHNELMSFCRDFSEREVDNPVIHDVPDLAGEPFRFSCAPVLETVEGVCAKDPAIHFQGKSFCFTGQARFGKRSQLVTLVRERGGTAQDTVTASLGFLVIGAQSQPLWAFSAYGRKIEKVVRNQKSGASTLIVREEDFLRVAWAQAMSLV